MTTENLRREARVDVCVPVLVVRGRTVLSVETSDISFKGLFIRTTDPPPLRSLVRLKVTLFDRDLEVHAMAVHVVRDDGEPEGRIPGAGLQFWGLSGPNRVAWDEFVGGFVQARRSAAKIPATGVHPIVGEPSMASGVRVVAKVPHASSK